MASPVVISDIPTQDEMAYRVGTVREVLCKCLHKLEKEDFIKVKRGVIIVNDIERLKEMVYFEDDESIFPIILPMKDISVPKIGSARHRRRMQ